MRTQVLVIGAGPVGLTMASELARYGVGVRIVDKAAERTDKSKAIVIWSRTLEMLDRAGCADLFVSAGLETVGTNLVADGKPLGHVDFSSAETPFPYALALPQSDTERLLEEHLATYGVEVERRTEAIAFEHDDTKVVTTICGSDGKDEQVESDWLIGCDGAHSLVRHTLGLGFEGDTLQSNWVLADAYMDGYRFAANEITTFWHAQGVLVVFPITENRFRIIADTGTLSSEPIDPTLDAIQAIVDTRGGPGMRLHDPVWLSGFRINERKVEDYRVGRVFVAGDAAHIHSPAGGQGMNTGMQDAFNLAWKLALCCKRSFAPVLLDSYGAERGEIGQQVLKAAGRLTQVAILRNQTAQHLRNLIGHLALGLAPVQHAMVDQMTEITLGYAQSPLNGPHAKDGPRPGARIPPAEGRVPFGAGREPRFAIMAPTNCDVAGLTDEFPHLLDEQVRPSALDSIVSLVRPDGYLACSGSATDLGFVRTYLRSLAGDPA